MKPKIKVAILEPNSIFRLGLKKILTDEDIEVVGEAADATSGMQMIRIKQPHIVILANDLSKTDSIHFCDWIHRNFPKIKSIFLLKNADFLRSINCSKHPLKDF